MVGQRHGSAGGKEPPSNPGRVGLPGGAHVGQGGAGLRPQQPNRATQQHPSGAAVVEEAWDFYFHEAQSWKKIALRLIVAVLMMVPMQPVSYFAGVFFTKKAGVIGIDQEGHAIDIPTLNNPVFSSTAIQRFCAEVVAEEGTFGFNDFDMRFNALQSRFTDKGWRQLNDAFKTSKIRDSVKHWNQTYATQTVGSSCTIINFGVINNRYWWKVRADAMRRITSGGQSVDTPLKITMELVRVGHAEARELVAVDRWEE